MKPVSLIVVLACALFVSFSAQTASYNTNVTLALGAPLTDVRVGENIHKNPSILPIGKPLMVLVKNLHDPEAFLPAIPTPFFEKPGTLSASKFQPTARNAISERPEEILSVQSAPFSMVDQDSGQYL